MDNKNPNEKPLIERWTEFQGRRESFLPPNFPDDEIVAGPYELKVNLLGAGYVRAFPAVSTIVVAANGDRHKSDGGYVKLPAGTYKIYYVDCQDRFATLPEVQGVTSDGANVTLVLGITYRVSDPMFVQQIRNPLDALFTGCEAAIRQIIRLHKHDELIGEPEDPNIIPNNDIAQEILVQISLSEACRAFSLLNVNVIDRRGHSRLLNIREQRAVQKRATEKEIESTIQRLRIAEEQKELARKQGEITEQQAWIERNRQEILYAAQKLSVQLENMRKRPQYQHEEILKDIEARSKALESLIQAQAMPGFPRNADDLHLVDKIVSGLPNITSVIDNNALNQDEDIEELNSNLIHLMIPKKK